MPDYEYVNFRRKCYGEEGNLMVFVPVCPICGRFVKADDVVHTNNWVEGLAKKPNATCKKCGRIEMPFEGFF